MNKGIKQSMLINLRGNLPYYTLLSIGWLLSIYGFFYKQINSDFIWIFSDNYDGLIEAILISHWHHVLKSSHLWNEPLYFFPYKDILGYNDGYFIYGLLGSLYRHIGFDLFLSKELVLVTVKSIGFFSMIALLNKLQNQKTFSIFGAILFTLFINSSNQAIHSQLLLSSFSPLLTILLIEAINSIQEKNKKLILLFGSGFVTLYASLLLTGFYMTWFYGLFLIIYTSIYVVIDHKKIKSILIETTNSKYQIISILFLFILSITPFLYTYLPKLKQTGGQDYSAQLLYSLHIPDLLNYGSGSFLWGDIFNSINNNLMGIWRSSEYQVGFTPEIFLLTSFILASIFFSKKSITFPLWFRVLAYTILISISLPISIFGHSLWFFVNLFIPGADGLRVIARFYIFLAFPIIILIIVFLSTSWKKASSTRHKLLIILILSVACLGQINMNSPTHLNKDLQQNLLNQVKNPPTECKSFFVFNSTPAPSNQLDRLYRQNIQAMLLADYFNLPTLNGFSTFNPPDWIFEENSHYLYRVKAYLKKHNIINSCLYNIKNNEWIMQDNINYADDFPFYNIGNTLSFSQKNTPKEVYLEGWSTPEDWGVWSNDDIVKITLNLSKNMNKALILELESHAFLSSTHKTLDAEVFINNQFLEKLKYRHPQDLNDSIRTIKIPIEFILKKTEPLEIKFKLETPKSPSSLGINDDKRKLGLGMKWIKISFE
jgi:hypothetical protein